MILPSSYQNKIDKQDDDILIIRSSVKLIEDCDKWVHEFGMRNNMKWNMRSSIPNGQRIVCKKTYVCHHSSFNRVSPDENKRGVSKNINCPAKLSISVKLSTKCTRRTDSYIKEGLPAVITVTKHNHPIDIAEALKVLPATECREKFESYFSDGMTTAEACKYHRELLDLEGIEERDFANSRINPTNRTVSYWYDKWRIKHPGPRTGEDLIQTFQPEEIPSIKKEEDNEEDGEILKAVEREQFFRAFQEKVNQFDCSRTAVKKAMEHLSKISSLEQCETMLYTLGQNVPLRRKAGLAIKIQTFSLARSAGITRGSKRIASGRPANASGTSLKKKKTQPLTKC